MSDGTLRGGWMNLDRQRERRMARRWHHVQRPWGSCTNHMGGVCLSCWWRKVTGAQARSKARRVAKVNEASRTLGLLAQAWDDGYARAVEDGGQGRGGNPYRPQRVRRA